MGCTIRSRLRGLVGTRFPRRSRMTCSTWRSIARICRRGNWLCRYTDEERYFVSESSVYRILKKADLITSPAYVLMSASDAFQDPTTRVHEMWQTDFTYFRIIHWGWYYLSTVLDDFSRYIIAWKLSSTMGATDVTQTLDEAIAVTGVDRVPVKHRPRLLSDNGSAYLSRELQDYLSVRRQRISDSG